MSRPCPYVSIQISPAELLDRTTILRIKRQRLKDLNKIRNVETELRALEASYAAQVPKSRALDDLAAQLLAINDRLWSAEDRIRECRVLADRAEFLECSEIILLLNDQRCAIKRHINLLLGSRYLEEKSYPSTQLPAPK